MRLHGSKQANVVHPYGPDKVGRVKHQTDKTSDLAQPPREGFRSLPLLRSGTSSVTNIILFISLHMDFQKSVDFSFIFWALNKRGGPVRV